MHELIQNQLCTAPFFSVSTKNRRAFLCISLLVIRLFQWYNLGNEETKTSFLVSSKKRISYMKLSINV